MSPDITININVTAEGASVTGRRQADSAGAAPPPMELSELQSVSAGVAPAPLAVETLQLTGADAGLPPPPMDVAQLHRTMAQEGPEPVAFGALQDVSAAPAPTLDTVSAPAAGGEAPEPMSPEALKSVGGGSGGPGPKR